jgi:hypothetical protein
LVTQRGDPQQQFADGSNPDALEDPTTRPDATDDPWNYPGEASGFASTDGASSLDLLYDIASPQQRLMLDTIANSNALSMGDVDRTLGKSHGQTASQLQRLRSKYDRARAGDSRPHRVPADAAD